MIGFEMPILHHQQMVDILKHSKKQPNFVGIYICITQKTILFSSLGSRFCKIAKITQKSLTEEYDAK